MNIVGLFSFNNGYKLIKTKHPYLLNEVELVIKKVNAKKAKTKTSKEKSMPGKILYNPKALNKSFKSEFTKYDWIKQRVSCDYPTKYYATTYRAPQLNKGAFREMDFIKEKIGIEVQFGKYAFMVYNVCAKMTIFNNLGFINAGIEIVPIKSFADQMSTGVSYFEQFVWDLEHRGVADIDIPVLILGIDK